MQVGDAKNIHWRGEALDADLPFIGAINCVGDQHIGVFGDQNFIARRGGFKTAGKVNCATQQGVVEAIFGAKITHLAAPTIDTHAQCRRIGNALSPPARLQLFHGLLHGHAHGHTAQRISAHTATFRITKKYHNGVADNFVHSAAKAKGNFRHLS